MPALITAVAFVVDWLLGDPQTWPHPVRMIGFLIHRLEKTLRGILAKMASPSNLMVFWFGAILTISIVAIAGLSAFVLLSLAAKMSQVLWYLIALYLIYSVYCLKDLLDHVHKVEEALTQGDLPEARRALSWIVGRDTASLNAEAIRRAEIETLAENFSDGLVAPFFYLALGGPVLAWIYKAANTLDSMVGYKNPAYLYFGRFSAKLDDVLNFLPSRIAALILIGAAYLAKIDFKGAYRLWRREGRFHSSPNSGQTEAAMAGALGVKLGGPNFYAGLLVDKPEINALGSPSTLEMVKAAERLVVTGAFLTLLLTMMLELFIEYLASNSPWGWGLN
ncbi:MAG: adenosylcobinamide-phosphate synthase CbiB [Deltaproteobacteria bacterium]|jgi:adenosylcobinamide-phosphate synthase|nr:adenosylcobinamide-phosphate synthase CbiB [Deltaproteobacteria bacterium]